MPDEAPALFSEEEARHPDCWECHADQHRCRRCGERCGHGWWLCPEHRRKAMPWPPTT